MDRYGYYMVRIQRSLTSARPEPPLAGVVEQLASGEKQSFGDGQELLRVLTEWADRHPNMPRGSGGGKA
jgi:hypothetical protein